MATIFPVFYKTTESCSETRHVWFTDAIPPADGMKCECGAKTWSQQVQESQCVHVWGRIDTSGGVPVAESEPLEDSPWQTGIRRGAEVRKNERPGR